MVGKAKSAKTEHIQAALRQEIFAALCTMQFLTERCNNGVCVGGGGGGESIPDEQLPFQYIVKKKPAATCPRVLLQIGNRQIVYCKIRFSAREVWDKQITDIIYCFPRSLKTFNKIVFKTKFNMMSFYCISSSLIFEVYDLAITLFQTFRFTSVSLRKSREKTVLLVAC